MPEAAIVVGNYLLCRFGVTLERALIDATTEDAPLSLSDAVEILSRRADGRGWRGEGRTSSDLYAGLLRVEGVTYHFCCSIGIDGNGRDYIDKISHFEPVEWHVRLSVPA